jgi:hypothetical protein
LPPWTTDAGDVSFSVILNLISLGGFIDEPQPFVKQKILFFDIFNQFLKSRNPLLCLNNNMTGSHRKRADFPFSAGRRQEEKNMIRC